MNYQKLRFKYGGEEERIIRERNFNLYLKDIGKLFLKLYKKEKLKDNDLFELIRFDSAFKIYVDLELSKNPENIKIMQLNKNIDYKQEVWELLSETADKETFCFALRLTKYEGDAQPLKLGKKASLKFSELNFTNDELISIMIYSSYEKGAFEQLLKQEVQDYELLDILKYGLSISNKAWDELSKSTDKELYMYSGLLGDVYALDQVPFVFQEKAWERFLELKPTKEELEEALFDSDPSEETEIKLKIYKLKYHEKKN